MNNFFVGGSYSNAVFAYMAGSKLMAILERVAPV